MKDFFMDEFDKKANKLLEVVTDELILELKRLDEKYPGNHTVMAVAAAGASMRLTKTMLRNYHEELLEYLQKRSI